MRLHVLLLAIAACSTPAPVMPSPAPWAVTPETAAAATVKVEATALLVSEDVGGTQVTEEIGWSGTAWVVQVADGRTLMVTAGHVCAADLDLIWTTYMLVTSTGARIPAEVVRRADTPDLCTLAALPYIGAALPISTEDPVYGSPVAYVGAPLGIWGDGKIPYFTGHYAGGTMITAPAWGGSSGSAVWGPDGVIGVLVSGYRQFPSAIFIEPRSALVDFLAL